MDEGIDRIPDDSSSRGRQQPCEVDASSSSLSSSAPNSGNNNHISLSSVFQNMASSSSSPSADQQQEQAHWVDVCRAYRQYAQFAVQQFGLNHPHRFANLPAEQQAVLPPHLRLGTPAFQDRTNQFKDAAIRNQFALDCILRHAGQPHSQQQIDTSSFASDTHFEKVSSVLKSLARDWSLEGERERRMAYGPILKALEQYVPRGHKVCVPGAGVGRIACEIAGKGYVVQGNEFSLYMLLASDYILNGPLGHNGLYISPWLLETRNVVAAQDPLRKVRIPDIQPAVLVGGDENNSEPTFSMAAGDFASIYSATSEAQAWDCVVACFFLDAVPNVVQYLQVVYHMLKPGGVLLQFGPLHWHWSGPPMGLEDTTVEEYGKRWKHLDTRYMASIDLTWEDTKQVMRNIGFEFVVPESFAPAMYTADVQSLLRTEYRCVQCVARKPVLAQANSNGAQVRAWLTDFCMF